MESETKQTYPCINGLSKPPSEGQMVEKKKANFLLLKDPFLDDKVQKKIYRYDGLLPGGQSIDLKDPRRRSNQRSNPRYRLWPNRQVMDLDVPRFKYDQNYIGTPPPNEVTFTNLNDNIDSKFLGNMCRQFGSIEEIKIYHHPKTKKHMGIGKVLFTSSKCAKACVDKLHQTSKMGNIINVMIDTMGKERSRIIEEMLADKPKNARRPIPPPERVDPRSHGRLYAAASTSSNRSVVPCNFTPTKSKYNDYGLEAYDPGDTEFDFGTVSGHRQLVNTSLENTSYSDSDYSSLQHCDSGYSVPQSEMSFSGHSDVSSSSYDSYGQYSSQHVTGNRGWSCTPHAAPYSYGVQQQYGQHNSGRQMNASYSQQQQQQQQQQHYSHSNYDATHQSCPPPEPTAHSHIESTSRSHSYSERREDYKDRSTSSFSHHHWEKEREREVNNREKCREKEHRIRPKTPEPEEPRNQSLESRLQSIFGLGGLGSPTESNRSKDHSSPSSTPRSRDEMCTPSPGVDSRYSSQQYPVSSRASSSGTCSSHVLQMPPLPPDIEEETKMLPNPTTKSDSSDRPDYSREPSSRTKRFEFKNSEHSNSVSHYDQLKTDKVTSAVASSSSASTTSRYRPESNDDNCSNGLLGAASGDFTNVSQQTKNFTATVTHPLPKHIPVEEKSDEKENNVDMEIDNDDDDDDDRMSLSSISSGEEKLEVNVQLPSSDGKFTTNNFHSLSSSQASRTAPPVPLITDFSRPPPGMQPWSYYSFGNYSAAPARMDLTTGTFNQSYCSQIPGSLMPMSYTGQALADSSLPQTASTTGRSENRQQEEEPEEKDPNDKTFLFVLDHFVRELKEVMQKDLCKKMVENSAFKSFELWWDTEEQKNKFQKGSGPNEKAATNKDTSLKSNKSTINTQQSGGQLTSGRSDVNSTLASLFETQHPWRQEGGFEAHYGGAHGGGFLGIRGVMPRMPSFKKKVFRPPSPPPPDDEDSKAAESFASNAEDESDDDVVGSSPSTRKKNVYASDEESASEDEKSDATASDDEEEGSDESSEDESDEEASDETSETSEEGSEEEEEEEEESEAKAKSENVFTSETKPFSISSESEKMASTNDIEDQPSAEESDFKAETRKIQDDSLKESSSESESEIDDSEKDTTESSSDAEPDQSVLFKPQLSPIKEEEEQDEMNREDKGYVNEKASVSTEHEVQERPELSGGMRLSARIDSGMLVDANSATCTPERSVDTSSLYTDISSDDQAFVSTDSKKTESSAQVSATVDDSDENKEITATAATNSTIDEEVPSTEISSEVTATSDEEASTDHAKGYMIPAIAEHDYVAMPPPLPVGIEIKSSEDSDHIEDEEAEEEEDSDRTESCDEDNTPLEILMDHNYCLPPAIGEVHEDSEMSAGWPESKVISEDSLKSTALLGNSAANAAVQDVVQKLSTGNLTVDEHAAAATAAVVAAAAATVSASRAAADDIKSTKKKKKRVKDNTLTDITNKSVNELEAETVKPIVKPKIQFQPRGYQEEKQLFFDIYNKGIDQEDINYLKRTYETLLQSEDPMYDWLNDIFWVDHTHTDIPDPVPPKKKRKVDEQITPVHKTGSARTEGFYKISKREKAGYLCHANKAAETGQQNDKKLSMTSREARHNIRRFQTNFGDLELGELFKFNQLKFRKKQLRFAKSSIHDWGLFALEPIAAEEMVIEYVGQVIRHFVADEREKQYGAQGIGSSYLFRVDNETIIDATKAGNLARFINHSCNPNCYAKIITVEAHKKIVIYSKRDIDVNEEITYDYKFPLEEEKISCLCGAQGCKGTLN